MLSFKELLQVQYYYKVFFQHYGELSYLYPFISRKKAAKVILFT